MNLWYILWLLYTSSLLRLGENNKLFADMNKTDAVQQEEESFLFNIEV